MSESEFGHPAASEVESAKSPLEILGIDNPNPTANEVQEAYDAKVARLADLSGKSPTYPMTGNADNFPKGGAEFDLVPVGQYDAHLQRLREARDLLMEQFPTGELTIPDSAQEYVTEQQWKQILDDGYAKSIIAHCVHNNYDLAQSMTVEDFKKFKRMYPTQQDFYNFGDVHGLTLKLEPLYGSRAAQIPEAAARLTEFLPEKAE